MKSVNHIVFYSGGLERRNGTGFLMRKKLKPAVLSFNHINDRICSIRLNARIFNIREESFRKTIGKESLHQDSNDNGLRVIDFATGRTMVM